MLERHVPGLGCRKHQGEAGWYGWDRHWIEVRDDSNTKVRGETGYAYWDTRFVTDKSIMSPEGTIRTGKSSIRS